MSSPSPRDPELVGLLGLVRRLVLTVRYLGLSGLLRRVALRLRPGGGPRPTVAAERFARHGRPVTVIITTYGPCEHVARAVASVRASTPASKVRVIVVDDASSAEQQARLRVLAGVDELILGDENLGPAANVNRGLARAPRDHDVVLLHADVVAARDDWLGILQRGAESAPDIGIIGAKLVYPQPLIQHAGMYRSLEDPLAFEHRHRFESPLHPAANVTEGALAVTGACMYVRRALLERIGGFDESLPMGYEDVDLCLRAWRADYRVVYEPRVQLTHFEGATAPLVDDERRRRSRATFWAKWSAALDHRDVRHSDGRLRVIYVLEDTGVGGGARIVFEHVNRLADRGHDVALYTLSAAPDWFVLRAPVRSFANYGALVDDLARRDAIKVATWWNTATAVWRASLLRGKPVFFVQDIETSYYPGQHELLASVMSVYRPEFHYMTTSGWNQQRLLDLGLRAALVPCAVDLDVYRPRDAPRRTDMVLALGRSNPLKNLPLTHRAWLALEHPRPELCLFGIEPELGEQLGARYVQRPTDLIVNELLNQAAIFVQTSVHEGFSLPPLEAMATGAAVLCTDADGNRDFCRDGENCVVVEPRIHAVSAAMRRLLDDPQLRADLGAAGRRTALDYGWTQTTDALEAFLDGVAAAGHPPAPAPSALPSSP